MAERMDTSYGGGFLATQDTADKRNVGRGRGSPWIPVFTSDVRDLLPGQDTIRRGILESSEVTFVGVIRSAERQDMAATLVYQVDDNTGPPLSVHQLLEEERGGPTQPLDNGTYIRVIGKVRTWGNQRGVTAFNIAPLKDMNEVSMHMLEVTYCKLYYAKDMLRRREQQSESKPGATSGAGSGNAPAPAAAAVASSDTYLYGLSGLNAEMHKFLRTATSNSGYHISDIQKRFPHLTETKIRDQLEALASEGHVYSTIDDDHYRTTDSFE